IDIERSNDVGLSCVQYYANTLVKAARENSDDWLYESAKQLVKPREQLQKQQAVVDRVKDLGRFRKFLQESSATKKRDKIKEYATEAERYFSLIREIIGGGSIVVLRTVP